MITATCDLCGTTKSSKNELYAVSIFATNRLIEDGNRAKKYKVQKDICVECIDEFTTEMDKFLNKLFEGGLRE